MSEQLQENKSEKNFQLEKQDPQFKSEQSDQQNLNPKQFCKLITPREMEYQSKIATQKALLELAENVKGSKESKKRKLDEFILDDNEEDIPSMFDMRDFFREYCDKDLSEDDKRLKVFQLLHQNSLCYSYIDKLKNKISTLEEDFENHKEAEEYQEEQAEEYIKELDEKDLEIKQMKNRISKLRNKCIKKNNSLFWWKSFFFITNVSWLGFYLYQVYEDDICSALGL